MKVVNWSCDICGNTVSGENLPKDWVEIVSRTSGEDRPSKKTFAPMFHLCSPDCYSRFENCVVEAKLKDKK